MRYFERGFTVIELLLTVLVLAVVVSIALPSFTTQIANNRSAALGSDLVGALNYARGEAVKRSRRVSICPSSDGLTCLTDTDWEKGWLVFVDSATSDGATTATVGTPLRHWNDIDKSAVIVAKKGTSNNGFIRFSSTGMLAKLNGTDADVRTFAVSIKGCTGESARTISLGFAGISNATKSTCPTDQVISE